jgi:hypothetical protein
MGRGSGQAVWAHCICCCPGRRWYHSMQPTMQHGARALYVHAARNGQRRRATVAHRWVHQLHAGGCTTCTPVGVPVARRWVHELPASPAAAVTGPERASASGARGLGPARIKITRVAGRRAGRQVGKGPLLPSPNPAQGIVIQLRGGASCSQDVSLLSPNNHMHLHSTIMRYDVHDEVEVRGQI